MKYWLIAVSSAVSTSFKASITAGSPRITAPSRFAARYPRSVATPTQTKLKVDVALVSARGDDRRPLGALGSARGDLARDQLAHGRNAATAVAPGMARERDLARRVRAAPDHFADLAIGQAPAVTDDHVGDSAGPGIGTSAGYRS